jgi:hypothetical protein
MVLTLVVVAQLWGDNLQEWLYNLKIIFTVSA